VVKVIKLEMAALKKYHIHKSVEYAKKPVYNIKGAKADEMTKEGGS
jgi:hypothetical protein